MDSEKTKRIEKARPFGFSEQRVCKVCSLAAPLFDVVDFYKHCSTVDPYGFGYAGVGVPYFRCQSCELLFTDFFDDWTNDDFCRFVYNKDYVKVDGDYIVERPRQMAGAMAKLFAGRQKDLRFLDYGSGSDGFAKHMRASGFEVESYDPFSHPEKPAGLFDVATCFEVVEHSPFPISTFSEVFSSLKADGMLLFSQTVQPANIKTLRGAWWYVAPRNGHVSTYSNLTFATIAERFGKTFFGYSQYGYAMAPDNAALSDLVDQHFRPISRARRLTAAMADVDAFHDIEAAGHLTYRWSKTPSVCWREASLVPGVNEFAIPYIMESEDNFAKRSSVKVDGRRIDVNHGQHQLSFAVPSDAVREAKIELVTPEPVCPKSRGVDDERFLGLAISDQ